MSFSRVSRRVIFWAILGVSFLGLLIVHQRLQVLEAEGNEAETAFYLPRAHILKPFLLGHEAFLADLAWIRTVGYFGEEFFGRQRYTYLERLLNFATDLDPRFEKMVAALAPK